MLTAGRREDDVRFPVNGLRQSGIGRRVARMQGNGQMHLPLDLRIADVERPGTTQFIDFGYVHNMRAAAGLVIQFGR